ncbi:MAG: sensor domain-containing diguanylate cyclase [Bacillota bacterium]|nr:sensor domain-containing diguanylate cyclase [Bacillota bacterium]
MDMLFPTTAKRRFASFLIPLLLLLLGFVVMLWINYAQTFARSEQRAGEILNEAAHRQLTAFDAQIQGMTGTLKALAGSLEVIEPDRQKELLDWLLAVEERSAFYRIGVSDEHGDAVLSDGTAFSVAGRGYFTEALAGETALEHISDAAAGSQPLFVLAVPIVENGKPAGVVFGAVREDYFAGLIAAEAYSVNSYAYLCDSGGQIICAADTAEPLPDAQADGGGNALALFAKADLRRGYTLAQLEEDFAAANSGFIEFAYNESSFYGVYMHSGYQDWLIVDLVDSELLRADIALSMRSRTMLSLAMLLFALATIIFMLLRERSYRRLLEHDRDMLAVSEQEYRIASEHGRTMMLRYDVRGRVSRYQESAAAELGLPLLVENTPDEIVERGIVAPESRDDYLAYYEAMRGGQPQGQAMLRLFSRSKGMFRWYDSRYTLVYDNTRQPLHAIVSFVDVTEMREKELAYEMWINSLRLMPAEQMMLVEYNITQDSCDNIMGMLFGIVDYPAGSGFNERNLYFGQKYVCPEDREQYVRMLNRERMLSAFYGGQRDEQFDFRAYREQGDGYRWVNLHVQMVQDPHSNDVKVFLLHTDIDESKRKELLIKISAETDALTGVYNRNTFIDKVKNILVESPAQQHVLIMVDLDGFKQINDRFGHIAGDKVLISVARNLKSLLRGGDLIGRIGGDEFMLCLRNIPYDDVITKRAELLLQLMRIKLDEGVSVSGSLGIAMYPRDAHNFDDLYRNADIAMYAAKSKGRDRYVVFSHELDAQHYAASNTPIDSHDLQAQLDEEQQANLEQIRAEYERLAEPDA